MRGLPFAATPQPQNRSWHLEVALLEGNKLQAPPLSQLFISNVQYPLTISPTPPSIITIAFHKVEAILEGPVPLTECPQSVCWHPFCLRNTVGCSTHLLVCVHRPENTPSPSPLLPSLPPEALSYSHQFPITLGKSWEIN